MIPLSAAARIDQPPLGRGRGRLQEIPALWPDISDERQKLARWRS
jgi:hypothetical protein